MPQTIDEFIDAYTKGYDDCGSGITWSPTRVKPSTVIQNHDLEGKVPLSIPFLADGYHSELVIGHVIIDGRQAVIALNESSPTFGEMLMPENGVYISMSVRFAPGFDVQQFITMSKAQQLEAWNGGNKT